MDSEEKLKQQVTEVAERFFAEHMSMNPESIVVDIHSDCLVVTLHKAISRAETAYTKEKLSSNLEEFHLDPNPEPDVQVSKHPALQIFLNFISSRFYPYDN